MRLRACSFWPRTLKQKPRKHLQWQWLWNAHVFSACMWATIFVPAYTRTRVETELSQIPSEITLQRSWIKGNEFFHWHRHSARTKGQGTNIIQEESYKIYKMCWNNLDGNQELQQWRMCFLKVWGPCDQFTWCERRSVMLSVCERYFQ